MLDQFMVATRGRTDLGRWPDWRGESVAIIASGQSTKKAGVERLKGRVKVIAIKQNVDLCPWADAVYGCDGAWWKHRRGLPEFGGLKMTWDQRLSGPYPDLRLVEVEKDCNELLLDEPGKVGAGGNSGFQALNLAVQFGARRILLVGFDLRGEHWYGRNNWPRANNPDESNFERWRAAFIAAAKTLDGLGVEVINASPTSSLTCFPKQSIETTLQEWA